MEAKLFADLNKILKGAVEAGGSAAIGSPLSKVILKHANKVQSAKLIKDYETLYTLSKGKVVARRKAKAAAGDVKDVVPGRVTKKIGITLGGYGHEAGAAQAGMQFLHPNVFRYQSALFPDPRTHSVKAKVATAVAIELKNDVNPLYPWGVRLELEIEGAEERVNTWVTQFSNQIRLHSTSG